MESKYINKSRRYFNDIAGKYESTTFSKHARRYHRTIIEKITKANPERVLDIGCGTGEFLQKLAEKSNSALYGIDIAERMIAHGCARRIKNAAFVLSTSGRIPFSEDYFDVITCIDSFHHFPFPQHCIGEISRVIKPGGLLFIADPWFPKPMRWAANMVNKLSHFGDFHFYSKAELEKLIVDNQFRINEYQKERLSQLFEAEIL